jgi:hypothetical protein
MESSSIVYEFKDTELDSDPRAGGHTICNFDMAASRALDIPEEDTFFKTVAFDSVSYQAFLKDRVEERKQQLKKDTSLFMQCRTDHECMFCKSFMIKPFLEEKAFYARLANERYREIRKIEDRLSFYGSWICIACNIGEKDKEGKGSFCRELNILLEKQLFQQRLIKERYEELKHLYDIPYRRIEFTIEGEEFIEERDMWLVPKVEDWIISDFLEMKMKKKVKQDRMINVTATVLSSYIYLSFF